MKKLINKIMVTDTVHNQQSTQGPIMVGSDIMSKVKIGCWIEAGYEEEQIYSDSAMDAHYYFRIMHKREETDAEYDKRKADEKIQKEELKKRRYQTYLKFKKEFEDEDGSNI